MSYPHLEFELPTSNYTINEKIAVVMLPAQGGEFEVKLAPLPSNFVFDSKPQSNRLIIDKGLTPGNYFIKARWKEYGSDSWSPWSPPLRFAIYSEDSDLSGIREDDHRLDLMIERGVGGVITLIDPDATPPNQVRVKNSLWFATPVYEGATPLVNEELEYYQNPMSYYLDCIDFLRTKGVRFLTWHDLLKGNYGHSEIEIVLQFDIDGGPKSMYKLYQELVTREVKATIMTHYKGHSWYPYDLEDIGIDWIQEAENQGWAIGYHNNALSQVFDKCNNLELNEEILNKAVDVFHEDVKKLRQYFNIMTYTHHGGNIYNLNINPSKELNIIGVDRAFSPILWKSITSMFSDGGFVSRPTSLKHKIQNLNSGLHFFRNHPFKYGNYTSIMDVPPRFLNDFKKINLSKNQKNLNWRDCELNKERQWLQQRQRSRSQIRLSYLRLDKPISYAFRSFHLIQSQVETFRRCYQPEFLNLYPWVKGDPYVFWWRMLDVWSPKSGKILNIGTLDSKKREEYATFISSNTLIREIALTSISKDKHFLPEFYANSYGFTGTLLWGVVDMASPSWIVTTCAQATILGGIGLFVFLADTHPSYGSLWHPHISRLWSKVEENENKQQKILWSFNKKGVSELFEDWSKIKIEFMGHHWFIVAYS